MIQLGPLTPLTVDNLITNNKEGRSWLNGACTLKITNHCTILICFRTFKTDTMGSEDGDDQENYPDGKRLS